MQNSFVGDKPEKCWLALYADASFAGGLRDSKSTSACFLVLVGPNTFAPLSWFCQKQGAVSHSSSEAEIISFDASVRMEGIPALLLWDEILEVFAGGNSRARKQAIQKLPKPDDMYDILQGVDFVPPSFKLSSGTAKCIIFEDNDAVIRMTVKERAPMLRHVARTHRVDLDWLFQELKKDPGLSIKFEGTKLQIADLFAKGSFTAQAWKQRCELAQVGPPSIPLTEGRGGKTQKKTNKPS